MCVCGRWGGDLTEFILILINVLYCCTEVTLVKYTIKLYFGLLLVSELI